MAPEEAVFPEALAMARIQSKISTKGVKRYYVTIRMKGQPTLSGVFDSKTAARVWIAKTESDIRLGRFLPKPASGRHTLADLIDKYIKEALPRKARTTQEADRIRLAWWKEHLGHLILKHLTPEELQDALPAIAASGRGNGDTSIRRHVAALSAALQAAREWRWIAGNPARELKLPPEPRGRLRYLSPEELARFLEAVRRSRNPMLAPAVLLSLSTGMRKGELLALTWDCIDLERGHVVLYNTKNGTNRGVPLTRQAVDVLREYGKVRRLDTPLVFPRASGKGGAFMRRAFLSALKAAVVADFRWHDLRHTCASYLAMAGVPLLSIAEILGHRTLQMTKRYAHLSADTVRADLEKMSAAYLSV